jgi:hypothetical protein
MGKRLPKILREIAGIIGHDAMLVLSRARGGTRIYIPTQMTEQHWLAQAIGPANATQLCEHFAQTMMAQGKNGSDRLSLRGLFIELPKPPISHLITYTADLSAAKAALRLGVTARTIHRHRAALRKTKGAR